MICENCHKERAAGREYVIHFGNKIAEQEKIALDLARIRKTFYHFAGQENVWICDRCSNRTYKWMAGLAFSLTLITMLMAIILAFSDDKSVFTLTLCVGSFGLLWSIICLISRKTWQVRLGEGYAKILKKNALRSQGFDAIFTDTEHKRLDKAEK